MTERKSEPTLQETAREEMQIDGLGLVTKETATALVDALDAAQVAIVRLQEQNVERAITDWERTLPAGADVVDIVVREVMAMTHKMLDSETSVRRVITLALQDASRLRQPEAWMPTREEIVRAAQSADPANIGHKTGNAIADAILAIQPEAAPEGMAYLPLKLSPDAIKYLQMNTEIGAYICENWSGAYSCMEAYHDAFVNFSLASAAAPSTPTSESTPTPASAGVSEATRTLDQALWDDELWSRIFQITGWRQPTDEERKQIIGAMRPRPSGPDELITVLHTVVVIANKHGLAEVTRLAEIDHLVRAALSNASARKGGGK